METNIPGCPKNLLIAAMVLVTLNIGLQLYTNHQGKKLQKMLDNE